MCRISIYRRFCKKFLILVEKSAINTVKQGILIRKFQQLFPNISSEALAELPSADFDLPWQSSYEKLTSKLTFFPRRQDRPTTENCSEMEQLLR
jgi:hypothetical protein